MTFCPNYEQMVPEAIAAKPDVVVVSGGRNDADEYRSIESERAEGAAVRATFETLRRGLPHAEIVAISPIWDAGPAPLGIARLRADVAAAVLSVGGTYVDIGEPLAGRPEWLAKDRVHPNERGHAAIADSVIAGLAQARG
jgi:lysophospholipase L1-like esterase